MNAIPCDTKIKSARSFLCECADLCQNGYLISSTSFEDKKWIMIFRHAYNGRKIKGVWVPGRVAFYEDKKVLKEDTWPNELISD